VSKSIYAILGIGLGSCVLLSYMMQHLLKVRTEHSRSPVVAELAEVLGDRLCGEITLSTSDSDGRRVTSVSFAVLAGLQRQNLATTAGNIVWRGLAGAAEPDVVRVSVEDEDGAKAVVVDVPRPLGMPVKASAEHKTGQTPSPAPPTAGPPSPKPH